MTSKLSKKTIATLTVASSVISGIILAPTASAATTLVLDTNLGTGTAAYYTGELRMNGYKNQLLSQIRELRSEAWDDARIKINGQTIPQLARNEGLTTKSAYVNDVHWDASLEHEVIQRAAEAALEGGHTRPNGSSAFTVTQGEGLTTHAELLAPVTVERSIALYATEKADLIANNGKETGHYTAFIDPLYNQYTLASVGESSAAYAGWTTRSTTPDRSVGDGTVSVSMALNPNRSEVSNARFEGNRTTTVGQEQSLLAAAKFSRGTAYLYGDYSTADSNIATVATPTVGRYKGVSEGTTTYSFTGKTVNANGSLSANNQRIQDTITVSNQADMPGGSDLSDLFGGDTDGSSPGAIIGIIALILAIVGGIATLAPGISIDFG